VRAVAAAIVAAALTASALAAAPVRQAPPLSGTDVLSGRRISLGAYAGRPVVVNVWGAWCGGCIVEAPALRRFAALHPGVVLLGIDAEDSRAAARAFAHRYGLRHPSIFDPHDVLARRLRVRGLPTTYFLDRRHRIVATVAGTGTLAKFERGLRAALDA
jgi:thiol-disulfide isomerase/thioredoxin